jgi:hypothetical protein
MNLSIIYSFLFALLLSNSGIQVSPLLGKWQLVYFDGIEKVRNSEQYRSSGSEMRTNIEYKIKSRLENTVYEFIPGDSLHYTDFENSTIVMKKAKIKLNNDNVLIIFDGKETREAKVVEIGPNKLVLEPISETSNGGKLVFERIVVKEKI